MKAKLEYIWLDGYMPTQSLRSKTQVRDNFGGTLEECPMWSFDGSSTGQVSGNFSDLVLQGVRAGRCNFELCEVWKEFAVYEVPKIIT